MDHSFKEALSQWRQAVGEDHVLQDEKTLDRYGRSDAPQNVRPVAVVKPATVEEIQAVLKIASAYRIPLYPISRGKNWGYGAACPVEEGNVLLDLGRMNRILEVNEKLAYAVVEPGVTQGQLYHHLEENKIPLTMDVTGAPPDASLIGNILERGYGQTPYSDHFLHSCGMEVVLADGRIVKTGFGHYPHAKTTYLYKWGVGPYLDGLFTQSNFGIVTKIGIWLMPRPVSFGIFYFKIPDEARLGEIIERLRELRLRGTLTSAVHLFNDIRVISSLQQYPWKEAKGQTPLPYELRLKLAKKYRISAWNCSGGLRGNKRQIRITFEEIRRALRGLAGVHFFSERDLRFLSSLPRMFAFITGASLPERMSFPGLMKGIPTEQPSLAGYWRKKKPAPQNGYDLPRDGCGLVWSAPVIPMTREDTLEFLSATRAIMTRHGFEDNISMNAITERALCCVVGLIYDKEDAAETEKAGKCYQELGMAYEQVGYLPYRSTPQAMSRIVREDSFWNLCRDLKKALDPGNILSPGRYNFKSG